MEISSCPTGQQFGLQGPNSCLLEAAHKPVMFFLIMLHLK